MRVVNGQIFIQLNPKISNSIAVADGKFIALSMVEMKQVYFIYIYI